MSAEPYDREQQIIDLAAISAAERELNALVAGERGGALAPLMDDYARIAGYFMHPKLRVALVQPPDPKVMTRTVARMFYTLSTASHISGFQLREYEQLLGTVRKTVKAMLIRRKPAKKKCLLPNIHTQPCACARLAAAQHLERERASFSAVGQGAQAPILKGGL